MLRQYWKPLRVVIATLVFALAALLFLGHAGSLPVASRDALLYPQFIPSLLNYTTLFGLAATGFIAVILLTLLCGRVYCSTLCPLGILQDVFIRLAQWWRPRRVPFHYSRPHSRLAYTVLLLTVLTWLSGSLLLINLLDPFSVFGRLVSDGLRPLYFGAYNLVAYSLAAFGAYPLAPVVWHAAPLPTLLIPLLSLAVLIVLSVRQGRLYCNTLCPVGTLLGLLARVAVFRIRIDEEACTVCAQCSIHCKAGCIHLKTRAVDFDRCVACYDCLGVCKGAGIGYRHSHRPSVATVPAAVDSGRRALLRSGLLYLGGLLALTRDVPVGGATTPPPPTIERLPVIPPGAQSLAHFNATCTACHLCVSACPTGVLQPAWLEYGWSGLLQPRLDFAASFCNFECTLCGELCPTGAILPLAKAAKQVTQLGVAHFIKELCIVYTDHTACGACSEHCPTKAVQMVPYRDKLTIPEVREAICIGCGACEYACPVRPARSIVVHGHAEHQAAQPPTTQRLELPVQNNAFPF